MVRTASIAAVDVSVTMVTLVEALDG